MLELNNVEVTYSDVILALKGVSMNVREGQCVALLGGNGAGKSTTLKAISGTLKSEDGTVSAGSITLNGTPIQNMEASDVVKTGLIHVMEGRRVLRHLTSEQNLIVGGHMVPNLFPGRAEQRRGAVDRGLCLCDGKRAYRDGWPRRQTRGQRGHQGILSRCHRVGRTQKLSRHQTLSTPQKMAGIEKEKQ